MPATYEPIATYTVPNTSTTTYTFSAIPQTYTDLVLWMSARNNSNNYGGYEIRLNGVGTGDAQRWVRNSNMTSTVSSSAGNMADFVHFPISGDTASTFTTNIIHICNYSQGTYGKPYFARNGGRFYYGATGNSQVGISVGSQDSVTAVTSIGIGYGDAFAQNSVFTLYGIKRA
jgi:hypothetical protein